MSKKGRIVKTVEDVQVLLVEGSGSFRKLKDAAAGDQFFHYGDVLTVLKPGPSWMYNVPKGFVLCEVNGKVFTVNELYEYRPAVFTVRKTKVRKAIHEEAPAPIF